MEEFMQINTEPFEVEASPLAFQYEVTINEDFSHVKQFENIVRVLEGATESDVMILRLNSGGGSFDSVLPLMQALKQRECHLHIKAGSCASAATFILLQADTLEVAEGSHILFHESSFGSSGTSSHVTGLVNHFNVATKSFMNDIYEGFLTEEELVDMHKGLEVHMGAIGFMKRWNTQDVEESPDEEPTIH